MKPVSCLILLALLAANAEARVIAANNGRHAQLVELFSSESCSSCPPADKWISGLKNREGLWTNFVPVVFHVDYWNNLGWKDGLSSPQMTQRQKEIASTWPEPSIYTPAVVVDGLEWRAWATGRIPENQPSSDPKITITERSPRNFEVSVSGIAEVGLYTVHIAKLGMGFKSDVSSGENSGLHLKHDFAVLTWKSQVLPADGRASFQLTASDKKAEKYAVVAWVEKNRIPIQATGGYL